ncbi:hemicentin-1 isoform X2 [Nilaparvata lugens]|uniref:hemicentin-1 isoform X2 n=1 Tax=Nilaparvata lugens TaxID=108931 RepID=UPI00193DAE49|nr:hemicentin-1 isoform X2 [Nilaparvata lugens]
MGWRIVFCLVALALFRSVIGGSDDVLSELDRPIPISQVAGVMGKKTALPCDIETSSKNDAVYMVLWFKEADGEPLYSFDVRGRQYGTAKLWSSPSAFGTRAFFRTATKPAELLVDDLQLTDEGIYRCRVDFQNSPTRNSKINLTVIVPPDKPIIFDGKRRDRTKVLEPYNEGSDINLICEVSGGRPRPKVIWYWENNVIDESFEHKESGLTVNTMTFANVGRQHLNSKLMCQASNTNLASPTFKYVILNINLKPLEVRITTKPQAISADKRYDVECRAFGSRPDAVITWWKGSRQMKKIAKNHSQDNNQSISMLSFTPVIDDDGKYLTCRAENPAFSDSALEDKWRLNVHYMPVVSLKMGSSLNPDDIKEGDDVYFECNIRANPKAYKLAWFHNGEEIHHNVTAGIILSDHSLVLQGVTRHTAGDFTCLAANTEGKGTSNPVTLRVMFVPTCKDERDELYGALKQETVALKCEVEANPPRVTFHWTFNNSGDLVDVANTRYTSAGTVSRLNYTPASDMDYGTLACWGSNAVGQQKTPCLFQVVVAGRPFPLLNCSVTNQTSDSLHVDCAESFDGGLPQSFVMELLQLPELVSRFNVTVTHGPPSFALYGIQPGVSYRVNLFAVNAKGRSDPITLETITFKGVAKYTDNAAVVPTQLLSGLAALAAALLVVVCCVVVALCRRRHSGGRGRLGPRGTKLEAVDGDDACHGAVLIAPNNSTPPPSHRSPAPDDTDPDIIPNKYDHVLLFAERRPLKGFMKMYKTPPQRRRKKDDDGGDGDDGDEGELADLTECGDGGGGGMEVVPHPLQNHHQSSKDSNHQVNNVGNCGTLRVHKGVTANNSIVVRPGVGLHNHKTGPEVVTASHRIQESCI